MRRAKTAKREGSSMLHKSVDRIFVALASDGDLNLCSLFVKSYQIFHSDFRDTQYHTSEGKNSTERIID
jgi:hypothetical protein